jgi:hypothetical protein
MTIKSIVLTILIFLAFIPTFAQVNVSMEFTDLTFPRLIRTYSAANVLQDDLRFKHRVNTNEWGNCVEKILSINAANNTDGISGGLATGIVNASIFNRNYQYWVENTAGNCSMDVDHCTVYVFGVCVWTVSDDRRTDSNENIDLAGYQSGIWQTSRNFYGNGASLNISYRVKFDMPVPGTPRKASGINYICGNTLETITTTSNLPPGFDESKVDYEWSYSDKAGVNPYNVITITSTPFLYRNVPDVQGYTNVGYRVRTRYRGGEWCLLPSAEGTFDVYPAAPTFTDMIPIPAKCHGELSGKIRITGLTNTIGDNKFTIAYINTDTGEPYFKPLDGSQGAAADIILPNLARGNYQVIIKNGDGINNANATIVGECHTKNVPNIYVDEPIDLPRITGIVLNSIAGTRYQVSCQLSQAGLYNSVGEIAITAIGGTEGSGYTFYDPFNFTIRNSPISFLEPKTYNIKVKDGNGCESQLFYPVTVLSPPSSITIPGTNQNPNRTNNGFSISCYEGTNGILSSNGTLTVKTNNRGNVGNITYTLYNSSDQYIASTTTVNGQDVSFTGLREGAYKVSYIDQLGCTAFSNNTFLTSTTNGLYLNQPPKLTITGILKPRDISSLEIPSDVLVRTFNGFDFSCFYSQDGFVKIQAQGGVPNIKYLSIPGLNQDNDGDKFYRNLRQKTPYTFTIEDANNCRDSQSITLISIPDTIKVESLSKAIHNGFNVSCNELNKESLGSGVLGEDGSVTIIGVGGVYFKKFDITHESSAVLYNNTSQNTTLLGNSHGQIFKNLPWSDHQYKIKDANGCVLTGSFNLTQPTQLSITGIITIQPICHHYRDGQYTITLAGGISPQYNSIFKQKYGTQKHSGALRNPAFTTRTLSGSTLTIDSVDYSSYRIDIKDVNGCTLFQDNIPMGEPDSLTVTNLVGNVPCKDGNNGRFITRANGGTFPYKGWMDGTIVGLGSQLLTFTGLSNKDYTLHITDAHGCFNYMKNASIAGASVGPVSIAAPTNKLQFLNTTVTSPSCFGYQNGSITPSYFGGYENPTKVRFSLDSIIYSDIPQLNGLQSGTYRIIVEETNDGGLCIITTTVGMPQPSPLSVSGISRDIACNNETTGMILLTGTGGNGGYLYSVSGYNFNSNPTFTGFDIGGYKATVKDSKNCPANTINLTISQPPSLVGGFQSLFSTCGEANGNITFSGKGGTKPYMSLKPLSPLSSNGKPVSEISAINQEQSTMHQVPSGIYSVELKDANLCTITISGFVNDLNGPTVTGILVKAASCSYSSDGATDLRIHALSASLNKTIWTAGDTVSKSQGATQLKGNKLYTVLAEDIYGCKAGDTVWVPAPAKLSASIISGTDPVCVNQSNGKLIARATGGTLPYSYAWNDPQNQSTATATGLSAISSDTLRFKKYQVSVLDSHLCTASGSGSLQNPMAVVVTLTSYSGLVCEGQTYKLNAGKPLHTRGSLQYKWTGSNGYSSTTAKSIVSVSGIYTIAVTDSMGCNADTAFALSTSINLLKALFGATTNVSVGDTIILVEYSWPAPDSVDYTIPPSFLLVTASGNKMYTSVVPQEAGYYELSMKVALAECQDQLTKHIHVSAATNTGSNLKLGYGGITEASLYPNPAGEYSILTLTLTDEMPVNILVRRAVGEDPVFDKTVAGKLQNEIQIDLNNFLSGVYIVYVSTGESVRVLKLTVVR